jgi:hypothetical protein
MSIFKFLRFNLLSLKYLIVLTVFQVLTEVYAEPISGRAADCKEIEASFEVISDLSGGMNSSIKIVLKNVETSTVLTSLIGPKKLFLTDIKESEIKDLGKGTYSLVIVGRDESSGYCPKQFQVIIK